VGICRQKKISPTGRLPQPKTSRTCRGRVVSNEARVRERARVLNMEARMCGLVNMIR
jgi:hypothetical protein